MGSDADAFIEKAQSYSSKNVERYKGNELSSGDTVYHYTNFLGLAGILKSKSIRLDETTHMHDRSESNNFRDVCVENYKAGIFGASSIAHRDARKAWQVECFWNYIEEVFKLPAYCSSFSSEPSLLSQWRAYAPYGGVSIGFDAKKLRDLAASAGFKSSWCVYDQVRAHYPDIGTFGKKGLKSMESPLGLLWRETLESIPLKEHFSFDPLERLARHTAIEAQRGLQPDNYVESIIPIMESAAEFFFKVSPIFKHDAFREESEFRIFCTELDHRSLEVDFRRDKLVRYTELRFEDAIPDIVRHVLLGPCEPLHEGALIDSVKIALDKAKIEEVSVLPSGIPLKTSS